MENNNKYFLITGVTSGIGMALAEKLLAEGAIVYGVGRDFTKIALNPIFVNNPNFHFMKIDLSNIEQIEASLTALFKDSQKLDGFVHCAGKEETVPLRLYESNKIEDLFKTNVFSGIELIRILSKKKNSKDGASFILLSSVMGELGQPGKVGYCATKAAVLGAVKAASLELAKRKIRVNAVSPGVVNTPMTQSLFGTLSEENINEIIKMHPLGIGEVSDVVPVLTFLLSDNSRWVTGQNFIVDGGYSIQ
jgi:NAD(P)-dependent dehydrogenase (short-subunit alcohol dehydrogenase family)